MDTNDLVKLLPSGYEQACFDKKAITRKSTGESLKNFTLAKGCLVIADRAYGTIKSMEHCLATGGDFIIRIKNKAFNIYDAGGGKLVFTDWLRTASETAEELNVYIRNSEKKLVPLRICACKKTKAEIAAEKVHIKKMESKKQKKLSDETVFTHNYMFVITSLPAEISAANRSVWRETKLASFIIFMMILPNIRTVSFDILELIEMSFIEKRKTVRQQLLCFS